MIELNNDLVLVTKLPITKEVIKLTIDSGAETSILQGMVLDVNTLIDPKEAMPIRGIANSVVINTLGKTTTHLQINSEFFEHTFHVTTDPLSLRTSGILGHDFLSKYHATISYEHNTLTLWKPKTIAPRPYAERIREQQRQINDVFNQEMLQCQEILGDSSPEIDAIQIRKNTENDNREREENDPFPTEDEAGTGNDDFCEIFEEENVYPESYSEEDTESDEDSECSSDDDFGNDFNFSEDENDNLKMNFCQKKIEKEKRVNNVNFYRDLPVNYFDESSDIDPVFLPAVPYENEELNSGEYYKEYEVNYSAKIEENENLELSENEEKKFAIVHDQRYDVFDEIADPDDLLPGYVWYEKRKEEISDVNARVEYLMDKIDLSNCDEKVRKQIKDIFALHSFAFQLPNDRFRHADLGEVHIRLKPNAPIVNVKQFRLPKAHQDVLHQMVTEMLEDGILEKSDSAYNTPVFLVSKKSEDGDCYRKVVNLKRINDIVEKIDHPMLRIDQVCDAFHNVQYFSIIDLKNAFLSIKLDKESKPLFAFSPTPYMKLTYTSLCFGFCNSPAIFLQKICGVLQDLLGKCVLLFIDDILIFHQNLEEHIETLKEIFKRIEGVHAKIKVDKTRLLQDHVKYLGFILSRDGMRPNPDKVAAIQKIAAPTNLKTLQSYLGVIGYYRHFIKDASEVCGALYDLLKKGRTFKWGPEQQLAFERTKQILAEEIVLQFPNFDLPFELHTDASDRAIGAVLSQGRPIAYFSKSLTPCQTRYGTTDKELFGVIMAVLRFHPYLEGNKFKLYTDHKSLLYLFTSRAINARLHRWKNILIRYNFSVVYVRGRDHVVPDFLSRLIEIENGKKLEFIPDSPEKQILVLTRAQQRRVEEAERNQLECEIEEPNEIDSEYYYIEEKSNMIMEKKEYDHLFFLFDEEDCELKRKVQYKLKKRIVLENLSLNQGMYQLDADRSIWLTTTLIKTEEQIAETEVNIKILLQYCEQLGLENIAINVIFIDVPSYFIFKKLLQKIFSKTNRKITIYQNRIIEITDINLINRIMYTYHNHWLGGHASAERMKQNIKRCYVWPQMAKQIKEYCKACSVCEKTKVGRYTKNPMIITGNANHFLDQLSLDILGPMASDTEFSYILTCICDFTKFLILIPLEECTALATAQALMDAVIYPYGFVSKIRSDRGQNFVAKLMEELFKLLKIKQILSSAYWPRGNSVAEAANAVVIKYVRAFVHETPGIWAYHLKDCSLQHNISVNSATGYSPFHLIYGRDVNIPIGILENTSVIYNYDSYVEELRYRLKRTHDIAKEHLTKRKEQNKQQYDKHVSLEPLHLEKNDLVLLVKPVKSHKFGSLFTGPYRVEKMTSKNNAIIRKGGLSISVNTGRLKKAFADYGIDTPSMIS